MTQVASYKDLVTVLDTKKVGAICRSATMAECASLHQSCGPRSTTDCPPSWLKIRRRSGPLFIPSLPSHLSQVGDRIRLDILRGGSKTTTVEITLGERQLGLAE